MWPDILWAGVALAGVAGSGITFRFVFPNEAKRLGRFLEVEILSRLPHPERKVTVEEAVLFEREVSLKWWDEEFRKLSTATDPMALAARNGWLSSHEVRQIQYGDMSFSAQSIYNATTARISEGGWLEPRTAPSAKCECEYAEVATYADSCSRYIRTAKCSHCKLEERPQVAGVFREVLA